MNPIDEFAGMRPDVDAPTPDELDGLWERAVAEASGASAGRAVPPVRRGHIRRIAVLGAAATIVAGVAALAFVVDRAEAPTGVSDTATTSTNAGSTSVQPTPPTDEAIGTPPIWTVTEAGWESAGPITSFEQGVAELTLVAGPGGVSQAWVAVVDGMSEPLVRVGGLAATNDDPLESGDPIIAWRTDPAVGNYLVSAGGVDRADAQAVFAAVSGGSDIPAGFAVLPDPAGSDAQLRVTQRFEHADGRWIEIETQSGGQPRYEVEVEAATATEFFEPPDGGDVADIAYADGYTVVMRTGFWVSTVRTSASAGSATDFADLVELIELDTDAAPQAADDPVEPAIDRLAVGDSVLLGAAMQLSDLGFTVDAVESRAFVDGLELVATLAEQDRLPTTMLVHLGGNGPIGEQDMDALVADVADVETVVFVTSAMDRDDVAANNELIIDAAAANANLHVLDWGGLAASCPGDCFEADGFHLTPDGREYYATMVAEALVAAGA